ncbi:MAG: outer membrane beta-barrel protein [bacterium]|nr:outer membrane beta-barrel protein [bacterium]
MAIDGGKRNSKVAHYCVVAVLVLLPAVAQAQEWTGNANALLGRKTLDEEGWAPLDEHVGIGVLLDFKKQTWPVAVAIDLLWSDDGEFERNPFTGQHASADAETAEVGLGLRKTWDHYLRARPYVGGGVAFISADVFVRVLGVRVSDSDEAGGIWINGGFYWTIGGGFNLGFDLRYSQAEVTLFGVEAQAGGRQTSLLVGYHW